MPKYYIVSGQLQFITVAENHMEACYKALQKAKRESLRLEKYFYVSERGFRGPSDSPVVDTDSVPDEQVNIKDVEDED